MTPLRHKHDRRPEPPRPASTPPEAALDCDHRSALPLARTDAAGTPCQCHGRWLYACEIHGTCRITQPEPGRACCVGCEFRPT
ncbi:unnamed protein product [Tuwongella immobilis]|uniref:Uncharacterized protein n=1 Tax=Tuwongella immobilis TaxID=692036 RepID=A0A6C2YN69_9BACT|nr:unnamed protein product [Tuwongella immobilis]VTS03261.1 unnamed protein product [Tuwongella immobilis]